MQKKFQEVGEGGGGHSQMISTDRGSKIGVKKELFGDTVWTII